MDKCREAFEKLPEINAILRDSEFGFNESINQYYHPNHTEHRLNYAFLMGAWVAWQARQAEADQLQSQINEMAEVGLSQESMLMEKDKRIEEALSLIQAWGDQSYRDDAEQLIVDVEEALRGERE